jgi:hypothetical protein
MTTRLTRFALAALASLSIATPASAAVTLNFIETGSGVVGSFSGSLDLTGMALTPSLASPASFMNPFSGNVGFYSASAFDRYAAASAFQEFGFGGFSAPTAVSGDTFGLDSGAFVRVDVPVGYVSGSLLSGSATFVGSTLADLGIALESGPFVYTLPSADTITITANPVPEPSTVGLMLAGLGVLGLVARRRRAVAGASQA